MFSAPSVYVYLASEERSSFTHVRVTIKNIKSDIITPNTKYANEQETTYV